MLNPDGSRSIRLQTRKGNDIPNIQDLEIPEHRRRVAEQQLRDLLGLTFTQVRRRRDATATYNCHGMTFALRRTGIYEPSTVDLILDDDGYRRIPHEDVLPGDIVLYYEANALAHSGMVVAVEDLGQGSAARVPIILSKWGSYGEYVHRYDICPYPRATRIQYFREAQRDT